MQKTYEQLDADDQQVVDWVLSQINTSEDPVAALGEKLCAYVIGTLIYDDSERSNADVAREAMCRQVSEVEFKKFRQAYQKDKSIHRQPQ